MFNPNDFFLFALVSVVILFILAQSVYFLIKAWRRAKELGFTAAVLKKTRRFQCYLYHRARDFHSAGRYHVVQLFRLAAALAAAQRHRRAHL